MKEIYTEPVVEIVEFPKGEDTVLTSDGEEGPES